MDNQCLSISVVFKEWEKLNDSEKHHFYNMHEFNYLAPEKLKLNQTKTI